MYNNTTKSSIQYTVNLQRVSSAIGNFCTTTTSFLKIIQKKTRYQSMSELNIKPPAWLQTENGSSNKILALTILLNLQWLNKQKKWHWKK